MVKFDNTRYVFDTSAGPKTLPDLFAGHRQLVVYQFMDNGPDDCCLGCTHLTSSVVDLVSWPAPASAGRQCPTCRSPRSRPTRHGWTGSVPFASSHGTTFADDCGAGRGSMPSVFLCDGEHVYRTYCTTARGVDRLVFINNILDLTSYVRTPGGLGRLPAWLGAASHLRAGEAAWEETLPARPGWPTSLPSSSDDLRNIRPAAASTPRTGSALYWRDTFARSLPIACTTIGSRTAQAITPAR